MKKIITLLAIAVGFTAASQDTVLTPNSISIGATTPTEDLEVTGTTKTDQLIVGDKDSLPSFAHAWYEGASYTNIFMNNSSEPTDEGLWAISLINGDFSILTEKDNYSTTKTAFKIERGTELNIDNVLFPNGNVGIGTENPGTWKLAVNGKIRAKEIKVEVGWSDFVFEDDYNLPTLEEVEEHIKIKGHLKDIPSAAEVEENGVLLGEMESRLLQKIEELTLYMIDLNKKVMALERENKILNTQLNKE